tara:strand:- start:555 stop:806 length:252 start_codon:yes stop_codon:yes gene_type:complete
MEQELMHLIWNFVLTVGAAGVGWWAVNLSNELKRVEILLNRTREEVARDYIQKDDLERAMKPLIESIEKIDTKLDDFLLSNQK